MELYVEVVHGADSSTDVVLDVEPAATFGDVADSLAFLRTVPNGGTTGWPTSTSGRAIG